MSLQSSGRAAGVDEIARLGPWFHNLHLPDGSETAPDHPLGDFPSYKWRELEAALPHDIAGWRVLDIGCNAGYYSVQLALRGAAVVGLEPDEHYLRQARFARDSFALSEDDLELRRGGVYDLADTDEQFDLVLFMGVLYHLRHPLLALDLVAEHVGRLLVLQTLTLDGMDPRRASTAEPSGEELDVPADVPFDARRTLLDERWPRMAFVEHQFAGDPTNWWVPNSAGVEALLRSCGMKVVGRPGGEVWLAAPDSAPSHAEETDQATRRVRGVE